MRALFLIALLPLFGCQEVQTVDLVGLVTCAGGDCTHAGWQTKAGLKAHLDTSEAFGARTLPACPITEGRCEQTLRAEGYPSGRWFVIKKLLVAPHKP